jgi:hypothetical protein
LYLMVLKYWLNNTCYLLFYALILTDFSLEESFLYQFYKILILI